MPASGLASSTRRIAGAGAPCTGSRRRPRPATTVKVRKGAIQRATAPAAENITFGKLALCDVGRQLPTEGDGVAIASAVEIDHHRRFASRKADQRADGKKRVIGGCFAPFVGTYLKAKP